MKISKWGLSSVMLFGAAFLVPWRYPLCVLFVLAHPSAVACSIVAAVRGSKYWFLVSAVSLLSTAQGVLALLVEC